MSKLQLSHNLEIPQLRRALLHWYQHSRRDLPWRRTSDPYRILVSEIMLQQTRVAAVIPYYERFLARFPDPQSLANAPEPEVLSMWAGLGYYSRVRNLQKAAREIVRLGEFPRDYKTILTLPGVGAYTAAAIASIAFGLPHAVLDGNVMRVLARLDNDAADISSNTTRLRMRQRAEDLLDPQLPSAFNQAMMELGATLCLPKQPQCLLCPLSDHCQGLAAGRQNELPVKSRKIAMERVDRAVLFIEQADQLLLWQRGQDSAKMKGFWELPEADQIPGAKLGRPIAEIRHSIVNHNYRIAVVPGKIRSKPHGFHWIRREDLPTLPLSTILRKALAAIERIGSESQHG